MISALPSFATTHLLVIGDVMLDRYWHGAASRISPEAPVPVVRVTQQTAGPGGAGNVAINVRALGGQVTLIGVVGQDQAAHELEQLLTIRGINCAFVQLPQVPTITKLRVLSRHQQLIRLDFEEAFITLDHQIIVQQLQTYLSTVDAIILSDYGKGTLANPRPLIQLARQANKPIIVDPKGRDFSPYRGATLITPNLSEFEAIVGTCPTSEEIVLRGEKLRDELALDALLVTRSQAGMTLLQRDQPPLHLPADAREVFDVTGAGDTVIAVLTASLAAGHNLSNATALANLAAGLVVAKLGAATVSPLELEYRLRIQGGKGIYDKTTLQTTVRAAQANGEVIVMTNGCFDVIHAGHVQYLHQARQLGDRLIVAVNDDASVQRLKGKSRPIYPLAQRMAVLNALEYVDWVVPFSEDTPQDLICQILPDILVKGGDYQVHEIAGSDCVMRHGGRVLTLDFLAGCSTTATLAALQQTGEKINS